MNTYALAESFQLCLTLCNPMDCSPPDSSVHGILHARILERVAIHFSRESFQPREYFITLYMWHAWWALVSCIQFSSVQSLSRVRPFATP